MKKILSLILCGVLLVACGNSEKTTSQDTNQDTKKAENKDTKTEDKKQSDWKWDLLVKDVLTPIIDTNYQKGSPTYDRKDLGGYVFTGDSSKNNGNLDRAYIFSASVGLDTKIGINNLSELETHFLIPDNTLFKHRLGGMLPGERKFKWIIQSNEKKKIGDLEYSHVKAEVEGVKDDGSKGYIHQEKPNLKSYVEGYFTVLDGENAKKNNIIYICKLDK